MSRFKVIEINGYRFEVSIWNVPDSEHIGKFFFETRPSFVRFELFDTFQDAMNDAQYQVARWTAKNPRTNSEWIDMVCECFEVDGYSSLEVDNVALLHVLDRYAQWKNKT